MGLLQLIRITTLFKAIQIVDAPKHFPTTGPSRMSAEFPPDGMNDQCSTMYKLGGCRHSPF